MNAIPELIAHTQELEDNWNRVMDGIKEAGNEYKEARMIGEANGLSLAMTLATQRIVSLIEDRERMELKERDDEPGRAS